MKLYIAGLNHEQNLKKMRLLSFMQMAESNSELSFDEITSELQIEEKDVEAFIIEGTVKKYDNAFILMQLTQIGIDYRWMLVWNDVCLLGCCYCP